MKKILTVLLVMAFVVTLFTAGVFAQGPQSKMGAANNQPRYNMSDRDFGVGYNRVELSEDQINEIADSREEFYNETEELRDQLRDLNREIRDLEFRGASNAEIGEVEDRIEAVLVQLDEKRITNQQKMESVLTEEQLNLIEENRLNSEERFQGRFNNEFGSRSQKSGSRGYSRTDDDFDRDMMGRGFSGSRDENNRDFGHSPGWRH
ncbi:MAG: Spy/CpxP family protein refolding chaperone [Halanaerobium sp.]